MLIARRVAECQLRLTPADQALAALIEADPIGAGLRSASDLAGRAGVHGATAGRFAKKLGFSNWRALQEALQVEHIPRTGRLPVEPAPTAETLDGIVSLSLVTDASTPGERAGPAGLQAEPAGLQALLQRSRIPQADPAGAPTMLSRIANGMNAQIEAMLDQAVGSTVEAAARRLCDARMIWIVARGDLAPIGQLLMIRLRRYGLRARLPANDGAGGLAKAWPKDVLLDVAGEAPQFRSGDVRRRAAARGLTVVLIGPPARADSGPPADIHVPVRAGQAGDAVLAGQLLGALALASTVKTLKGSASRS